VLDVDAAKPTIVMSSVGASRWWNPSVILSGSEGSQNERNAHGASRDFRILRSFAAAQDDKDPFLSFPVPAGHMTVRIRYADLHFRIAALIALLTAAVLVCFMIRARVQRHLDLRRRALCDRDRMRTALDSGGP
jgi:hypothetical protein